MKRTFELVLVEQCAPTLAGVKPASLFRYGSDGIAPIRCSAAHWDRMLAPLGVRIMIIKECPASNACMIFVYRASWLERLLTEKHRLLFLKRQGYSPGPVPQMLGQLSQRLCLEREYPHEIGVFLGYPLADVVGFIENRGWNYTCCGYWKSYGDPAAAQKCFARYRSCTDLYKRRYAQGTPLLELVVAA
ncbi:DUF3793 family protein [Dysosmobacter sp.]